MADMPPMALKIMESFGVTLRSACYVRTGKDGKVGSQCGLQKLGIHHIWLIAVQNGIARLRISLAPESRIILLAAWQFGVSQTSLRIIRGQKCIRDKKVQPPFPGHGRTNCIKTFPASSIFISLMRIFLIPPSWDIFQVAFGIPRWICTLPWSGGDTRVIAFLRGCFARARVLWGMGYETSCVWY